MIWWQLLPGSCPGASPSTSGAFPTGGLWAGQAGWVKLNSIHPPALVPALLLLAHPNASTAAQPPCRRMLPAYSGEGALRSAFFNSLKEAACISRGSAQRVMEMAAGAQASRLVPNPC